MAAPWVFLLHLFWCGVRCTRPSRHSLSGHGARGSCQLVSINGCASVLPGSYRRCCCVVLRGTGRERCLSSLAAQGVLKVAPSFIHRAPNSSSTPTPLRGALRPAPRGSDHRCPEVQYALNGPVDDCVEPRLVERVTAVDAEFGDEVAVDFRHDLVGIPRILVLGT